MNAETDTTIDRARAYGDGLFETIAIRDGVARFWGTHMARLQISCEKLGITCPPDTEIRAEFESAMINSDIDLNFASARLVVAAGQSKRGYRRDPGSKPELSIDIFPSTPLPKDFFSAGVAVRQCNLRLAEQPALAGIKTLNRLEQVLARAEWDDPEIFEGLLLDTSGRLICGTMSNVFAVIDSTICTPALNRCGVAGVMREQVMQLSQDAGIDAIERDIVFSELGDASELFLTNSQFGVLPIRARGGTSLAIGPVTRRAQSLVAAHGVPECSP